MPFSPSVREETLVRSHRRCCICHEFAGRSVNVHHVIQEADGGLNTIDNAICLCLRCHAEAGHFNSRHPLGTKYAPTELLAHRDQWWKHCLTNPLPTTASRPELWCKAVGLDELAPDCLPKVIFEFENIGDANAYELRIETGVYPSYTVLTSDPPPMEFTTPTPTAFLPRGRVTTKTISFGRSITTEEFRMIEDGTLHVYAYGKLTYGAVAGTPVDQQHRLCVCFKYNPVTTFFQNTPFFNSTD
jgi:HNH endonuclease